MQALIFANGHFATLPDLPDIIEKTGLIVAADGGAVHCASLGLLPHVVLGDFDSIPADLLESYQQKGVELHRHPVHKDRTDLELALDLAMSKGARRVVLLGVLGGRWDMSMANMLLAAQEKYRDIFVSLVDNDCLIRILHHGREHVLNKRHGIIVSLLPLGGEVSGITLTGFRYPLVEQSIPFGSSHGVSNVLLEEYASVYHRAGVLLCVQQNHGR